MQIEWIVDTNMIIYAVRLLFICTYTYFTSLKILNIKFAKNTILTTLIWIICTSVICTIIKTQVNFSSVILFMTFSVSVILSINTKSGMGYSIIVNTLSSSFNYCVYFISTILSFIPFYILKIENEYINFMIIMVIYTIILLNLLNIKKIKYGIIFFKENKNNNFFDILILNISIIILFSFMVLASLDLQAKGNAFVALIIFSIIMFITIQKSLQLYYKQKLQQRELEETKEELEKAKKEIAELEQENLNFSKKSHSIAHKQKALEYKLDQLLLNNEIAEEIDIKDKIKEISKQIQNEDTTIELTKTNIEEIDDMLKYMQSECKKNKINFELQVNGNIHHMINKYIAKENLEILLADHIKNAIIAINHSENINRSILVKLGLIDGIYSIYIYDTGIEFEIKTLQNLGQVPSTTHADDGGTGMGFMNTFDTLNKYKASIIINEYGKPSKDNYTKYIAIKFDNKNEYKITSYRSEEIEKQLKKDNKITIFNNLKN